jgi:hypothetical protein
MSKNRIDKNKKNSQPYNQGDAFYHFLWGIIGGLVILLISLYLMSR